MSTRPISTGSGPGTDTVPKPSETGEPGDAPVSGAVARASVTRERIDVEIAATKVSTGDGVDVAVFSASIKTTAHQATLEGKMFSVEIRSEDGQSRASLENFSAKLNSGTQNPDGSTGGNFGIGANIIGVEGTVGYRGSTVTGGLAVGAGAELSVGFRDLDKDGSQELCARVSAGFVTLGLCVENPF